MFSPEASKEFSKNANSNTNPFGEFPPQDFDSNMFTSEQPGNNENPNPFGELPAQDFSFGIGENFTAMTNDDIKDFMDAEEEVLLSIYLIYTTPIHHSYNLQFKSSSHIDKLERLLEHVHIEDVNCFTSKNF